MSWTKRNYVTQAFNEIGLGSFVYDLSPEQLGSCLTRLDAMMASWNERGIKLGYPIPSSPGNSDLDQETGVPDRANEAIYSNLAIKLAASYGKIAPPELKATAKMTYDVLMFRAAMPEEMQFPNTLPSGSGNKPYRNIESPFVLPPSDPPLFP